jgi:TPP-dependent pyruvate/acetoin dehydrogenase alpha subunit
MVTRSKNSSAKRTGTSASTPATGAAISTNGSGPSNRETLRKLYASLLRCRLIEEQLQRTSNPVRYEFVTGEEAVAIGAVADLNAGDTLAASPRDLAALLAGGAGVEEICDANAEKSLLSKRSLLGILSLDGTATVSETPSFVSLVSLSEDPFILGTGIALAHKLARERHVVVAIAGQLSSLEPWREAFQMALSQKLPIVYVMKNGGADQSVRALHLKPVSFMAREGGFPGIVVDGQDVIAVRRVAQESVHRARNRGGPTLIDCRTEAGRDPLAYLKHYMRKRRVWDEKWSEMLVGQIGTELRLKGAAPL